MLENRPEAAILTPPPKNDSRPHNEKLSSKTGGSGPNQWLIVAYDVPNEPSKFRVKVWRDLKSQGGLYPQMSFCILPYSQDMLEKLEPIKSEVERVGSMIILQSQALTPNDKKFLRNLLNDQTERQYLEILEECQEFLDEVKSNIAQKVFKDEEIQELDESLEGLNRWFAKIQSFDWQKSSKQKAKVKQLLLRCQKELDDYAAQIEARKKKRA